MSNSYYPKELEELISILKEFPGIGQRGAERIAFCMLRWPEDKLNFLGEKISNFHKKIRKCQACGNLCENDLCRVCSDPKRDSSIICILEDYTQIPSIEKSGFKGVYHCSRRQTISVRR
jgi:recombination protein RecR